MRKEPALSPLPFSDYIVYVDESGDHSLTSIDPKYPIFVLAFCVFKKSEYVDVAVPSLQRLKFRFFGHDSVVLHEQEITKSVGPFRILFDRTKRDEFFNALNGLIETTPFRLIAVAIRKDQHRERYATPEHPYHLAVQMGLERLCMYLVENGQEGCLTSVIFESRGKREDQQLELEFRRLTGDPTSRCAIAPLDFQLMPKAANSCGLQIADLLARPIGRHVLNPNQPNRAFEILRSKFRVGPTGGYSGYGLTIFP
jgi:hypothetical protein